MPEHITAAICVLNSKYVHSSLAPWCLLAGVRAYCDEGITARVAEGTINEPLENVARRVIRLHPQVVGFCCYIWNIAATTKLIKMVKDRLPEAVIVLGGPEVGYRADEVLRGEPLVRYVIAGEGEKPFALLLNAMDRRESDLSAVPGLCYRRDGQTVSAEPYTPREEPPSPYTDDYFRALGGRIAYLETSRGCPFSCAFCLSGRCGGVRYFDLERAKRNMLLLAGSGTRTVKLVDRTFNADRRRARELFRFMIQNYGAAIPKGVCFHFEIAGDLLDDETLALLATAPAGAMQLEIGLQSFNGRTLSAICRKTDVERLKANIRRLVENGNMHIHIDLIAGLPYEDMESFGNSFNTAFSLRPHMLQLGFLKLLYGAPMRENAGEFPCRYSERPPYEVTETPWMSSEELTRLHSAEDALQRLYNSGRFRRTVDCILAQTGMRPFELFGRFGEYCAGVGIEKIRLDDYTALVMDYFGKQNGVDAAVLRDAMVCDRLATNSSGCLPPALGGKEDALKAVLKRLKKSPETCPKKEIKRGAALLRSERVVVYADYEQKNPVSGEYELHKVAL